MSAVESASSRREYETIYILKPDVSSAGSDKVSKRVQEIIDRQQGVLTKVENWGRRKLAYPVRKHIRGVYFYLAYAGEGQLVRELERNLRLDDQVLKFQTVKLSDEYQGREVNAEDVAFEHLEPPEEEEDTLTLAQSLGLESRYDKSSDEDSEERASTSEGESGNDAEAEAKSDDSSAEGGGGDAKADESAEKKEES